MTTERLRGGLTTAVLLSPWIATLGVFWVWPVCYALWLSFTKYKTLSGVSVWVGLDNYANLLADPAVHQALGNTSLFTAVTVPITTSLALALAIALNGRVPLRGFFRSAYFLPSVTSLVVIALVFTNLYSRGGYLGQLASLAGVPWPENGLLLEPSTALWSIIVMEIWISAGYYMVLFLAALQTIPKDLYEAARLDGASAWRQFTVVTLPMLRPTMLFVLVLSFLKAFQVFIEVYVMTKGGPLGTTTTIIYLVYEYAFEHSDAMGYAAALAYIAFVIILIVSAIQMRIFGLNRNIGE